MSQNYDDIQAQLAAYIDGALPPEQQAEIEKHLAANPSHLALMRELMGHRRIIARLPRVKAPADLSEELLGQLEREQLLSEPVIPDDRPVIFRLFGGTGLAAAACALLMVGLVVAIYHIMPGRSRLAVVSPAPGEAGAHKSAIALDKTAETAVGLRENESAPGAVATAAPSPTVIPSPAPMPPAAMKPLSKDSGIANQVRDSEKPALTPSAQNVEQVVLAVAAPDVDQANGEVLRFLTDNDIAWSVGAEDAARNLRNSTYPRVVALSESARIEQYSRAIAEETKNALPREPLAADNVTMGGGSGGGGGSTPSGAAAKAPTRPEIAPDQVATAGPADKKDILGEVHGVPLQPGDGVADAKLQMKERADTTKKSEPIAGYTNQFSQASNRLILARGLKASQIEQLATVLDRPAQGQSSVVRREVSENSPTWAQRTRQQKLAEDLADGPNNAKPSADENGKVDQNKSKNMDELVATKQEVQSEPKPFKLMAKRGVAMSASPTTQPAAVALTSPANAAVDSLVRQQPPMPESRVQVAADPPSTRPADNELYDVLIVLSPAPAAHLELNAPPAAASPVPAAAPASQPRPDAKRE